MGEVTPQTKYFILACHGYGQRAKHFIRKFNVLESDEVFVLAPEGLSMFYWKDFTGDVVASWMTKENRLSEIEDYANFIQQLYLQYTENLPKDAKIILLGFSQGCATIMRWVMREFPKADYLSFWGGVIPEDLDYTPHLEYFDDTDITFFHGDKDHLLTPERLVIVKQRIAGTGIRNIKEVPFEGGHTVERSVLLKWFDEHVRLTVH